MRYFCWEHWQLLHPDKSRNSFGGVMALGSVFGRVEATYQLIKTGTTSSSTCPLEVTKSVCLGGDWVTHLKQFRQNRFIFPKFFGENFSKTYFLTLPLSRLLQGEPWVAQPPSRTVQHRERHSYKGDMGWLKKKTPPGHPIFDVCMNAAPQHLGKMNPFFYEVLIETHSQSLPVLVQSQSLQSLANIYQI